MVVDPLVLQVKKPCCAGKIEILVGKIVLSRGDVSLKDNINVRTKYSVILWKDIGGDELVKHFT
jgi:hypothetical protein